MKVKVCHFSLKQEYSVCYSTYTMQHTSDYNPSQVCFHCFAVIVSSFIFFKQLTKFVGKAKFTLYLILQATGLLQTFYHDQPTVILEPLLLQFKSLFYVAKAGRRADDVVILFTLHKAKLCGYIRQFPVPTCYLSLDEALLVKNAN